MCSTGCLEKILSDISSEAKTIFGARLKSVILYGSYARGDYDSESDIDVMILADIDATEIYGYQNALSKITSRLGLENDVVISLVIKDSQTFEKFLPAVPFYQNVVKEGVPVAV